MRHARKVGENRFAANVLANGNFDMMRIVGKGGKERVVPVIAAARDAVERYLAEGAKLGVKEYYFTGGEPFLNPEMEVVRSEVFIDTGVDSRARAAGHRFKIEVHSSTCSIELIPSSPNDVFDSNAEGE